MAEIDSAANQKEETRKSAWQRLWADKVARVSLIVLLVLYLAALFADPLTPYSMHFNDPDLANAPPTRVHFQDESGAFTWPYVHTVDRTFDVETFKQSYIEKTDKETPLVVCCYHGNSSRGAAEYLSQQGFKQVYSMTGGFDAWPD